MDESSSPPSDSVVIDSSSPKKLFIKKVLCLLAIAIVLAAFYLKPPVKVGDDDCYSEFSKGQWVHRRWYPYNCIINRYPTKSSLRSCVEHSQARHSVHFFGDANLATYFRALVTQFTPSGEYMLPEDLEKDSPVSYTKDDLSVEYSYFPMLNYDFLHVYKYIDKKRLPLLIVNEFSGFSGDLSKHSCFGLADKLIKYQTNFIERAREEIHITPIILIFLQDLQNDDDRNCQNAIKSVYSDTSKITPLIRENIIFMEIDNSQSVQGLETIIHFLCNSKTDSTCCIKTDSSYYWSKSLPFLLVCLAMYMGLVLLRTTGTLLPLEPYLEAGHIDLNKTYTVINLVGLNVICALYICTADRLQVFFQAGPWRSPLLMSLFFVAIVCLTFLKIIKLNQSHSFLCRDQLLEWRGWTVLLIVGLEYTDIVESNIGFWLWHLLVCCYSFTCGYSHFVWFTINNDYSLIRVIKVIVKQNYLVIVIIATIFSPITIYTLPLVNTVVFIIVYIVMVIPPILPPSDKGTNDALLIKIAVVSSVLIIETIFELLYFPESSSFSNSSYSRAWIAILYSSRMMAILGMLMGYYSVFGKFNQVVALSNRIYGVLALIGFGVYSLFIVIAQLSKLFTLCHMIIVVIPIISYCFLRNGNDLMKTSYSLVLKYTGAMSLEFFVLSRHLLLSHNSHGLLYLFPGYFAINMLSTLFIVLLLSYCVSVYGKLANEQILSKSNPDNISNGDGSV